MDLRRRWQSNGGGWSSTRFGAWLAEAVQVGQTGGQAGRRAMHVGGFWPGWGGGMHAEPAVDRQAHTVASRDVVRCCDCRLPRDGQVVVYGMQLCACEGEGERECVCVCVRERVCVCVRE